MQITVTQEDIDNGIPRSPTLCPIGLATRRAYSCNNIRIGSQYLRFLDQFDVTKILALPHEVTTFIFAFDRREPVQPFTFTLGD